MDALQAIRKTRHLSEVNGEPRKYYSLRIHTLLCLNLDDELLSEDPDYSLAREYDRVLSGGPIRPEGEPYLAYVEDLDDGTKVQVEGFTGILCQGGKEVWGRHPERVKVGPKTEVLVLWESEVVR